jgi:hypothetical protein
MKHKEDNNLFNKSQCRFRSKHNYCVLQLLDVLDKLMTFHHKGKQIDMIYLDIQKAFDSVGHLRLLPKLKGYGFEGEILQWIKSFLMDRKQGVLVNGQSSEWKDVTSGIPQGTVLGLVLFIIYMNDMPDRVTNILRMIADDSKIFTAVTDSADHDALQETF